MKVDNTSREYDTGITSGFPPNHLWPWFRGRGWHWEGKYGRGWLWVYLPFSQERKVNHLGRNNFPGLQGPEIYQEIMAYRERALSHMLSLGENQVVPQHEPHGQLHNWICNQYLQGLQPKTLLTPLPSFAESTPNPVTGWFTGLLWGHDYQVLTQELELNS